MVIGQMLVDISAASASKLLRDVSWRCGGGGDGLHASHI